MKKFKIKKGDQVIVLTGKDRGKKGEVLRMLLDEDRAVVAGINVAKKHQKPGGANGGTGGIIQKELPIHVSNVALLDPKSGKATRVGYKILENGEKVRIARRSGEVIA